MLVPIFQFSPPHLLVYIPLPVTTVTFSSSESTAALGTTLSYLRDNLLTSRSLHRISNKYSFPLTPSSNILFINTSLQSFFHLVERWIPFYLSHSFADHLSLILNHLLNIPPYFYLLLILSSI